MTDIGPEAAPTDVADDGAAAVVERRPDGKRPKTPLAGPYGHPFHPILVTVPIGAWVSSFVFDIISKGHVQHQVFAKGAFWLILIGIVGAVIAGLFGLLDLLSIPRGTRAFKTGLIHLGLNVAVIAIYAVDLLLRRHHLTLQVGTPKREMAVSAVALVLLGASGYLGGKLAYRYGIRVADEGTQAEGLR